MLIFSHLWIFALLPLPWLLRLILPARRTSSVGVRVPFGDRLRSTGPDQKKSQVAKRGSRWISKSLIWLLLITALARPQWLEPAVSKNLPTRDLLLLVDLSGSMQQEDFTNSAGETVDRLTAVKEVLGDFLEQRDGDRVGLVVFGDSPFLQSPFSTDLSLSRRLLDETAIGMAGPRTAFGDAIGLGISLFDDSDAPAKTIIALTDGNDTKSDVPPVEAARIARDRDIRIHTVAIGDPTTLGEEKLDEEALREVASAAGGSYFFAADRKSLEGIYKELDQIETREVQVVSHRPRRDLYYYPVLLALLISVASKLLQVIEKSGPSRSSTTAGNIRVHPTTGKLEVLQ